MDWIVERLADRHDRSRFDCGHPLLDNFLRQLAGQYGRRNLGQTYVLRAPTEVIVSGYYTISTSNVLFGNLPAEQARGLPKSPVPVVLLGRLAVDRSMQGQGLGRILLVNALRRIASLATEVGISAVEVHAIDDAARDFYLKYGFTPLIDDHRHLYLAMKLIRKLM